MTAFTAAVAMIRYSADLAMIRPLAVMTRTRSFSPMVSAMIQSSAVKAERISIRLIFPD